MKGIIDSNKSLNILLFGIFLVIVGLTSCNNKNKSGEKIPGPETEIKETVSDTLTAVTLYGPTSYFIYRGEEMGFDYENLKAFAESNNKILKLKIAHNFPELLSMIEKGEADLAAYPIPYIEEYREKVLHCGPKEVSWQVLVQKQKPDLLKDVSELIGKDIYVEKDSKYDYRINNLNNELGGGINIHKLDRDSIGEEDLIDMVSKNEIPYTIVDSDIALINKSYYPDLDISLKLSLEQNSSWAVAKGNENLAKQINNWDNRVKETETLKNIYKKYFEESKNQNTEPVSVISLNQFKNLKNGPISQFDDYFKSAGTSSGIDWKLLAAVGYNESRFTSDAVSRYGAKGVMQIMDVAARGVGESQADLFNPSVNINIGSKVLVQLDESLQKYVQDPLERQKFVLAAYNSGLGHIYDSIELAKKYGLNPQVWNGNVSEAALMKSRPEYYNDPVVKHGYFRGRETVDFVKRVTETYEVFKGIHTD